MTMFDVAILIRACGLCFPALDMVMIEKLFVIPCELFSVTEIVHCRTESVGAVLSGNPAKFPESVLEARTEALKTFREAYGPRFPVRIGKNKMIQFVDKMMTANTHP